MLLFVFAFLAGIVTIFSPYTHLLRFDYLDANLELYAFTFG